MMYDSDDEISITSEVSIESTSSKENPLHQKRLERLDKMFEGKGPLQFSEHIEILQDSLHEKENRVKELSRKKHIIAVFGRRLHALEQDSLPFDSNMTSLFGTEMGTLQRKITKELESIDKSFIDGMFHFIISLPHHN